MRLIYGIEVVLPRQIQNFRRTRDRRLPKCASPRAVPLEGVDSRSRHHLEDRLFNGTHLLYDFIDDFAHQIAEMPDEDAGQHYRRLPE